jgi:hypothetical protein
MTLRIIRLRLFEVYEFNSGPTGTVKLLYFNTGPL